MSNETRIFGYIEAPARSEFDKDDVLSLNWKAINNLPDEDKWPWLVRGMFALAPERVSYRGYLFHFAAAIKGIDEEWDVWLEKFEGLLKQMFWHSVQLRLVTEYVGDHDFAWVAELPKSLEPVKKWKFFGKHRDFKHVYSKKI